jgi:hypothetical protein
LVHCWVGNRSPRPAMQKPHVGALAFSSVAYRTHTSSKRDLHPTGDGRATTTKCLRPTRSRLEALQWQGIIRDKSQTIKVRLVDMPVEDWKTGFRSASLMKPFPASVCSAAERRLRSAFKPACTARLSVLIARPSWPNRSNTASTSRSSGPRSAIRFMTCDSLLNTLVR